MALIDEDIKRIRKIISKNVNKSDEELRHRKNSIDNYETNNSTVSFNRNNIIQNNNKKIEEINFDNFIKEIKSNPVYLLDTLFWISFFIFLIIKIL